MNKHDYAIVDADVLIIGGGSAGIMAAIRAKQVNPEQKVVIFEKGEIKYSGCIARGMDALNIVALPGVSTPELYVESNSIACEGIMDEPVNYRMAQRSWDMMKKLESWDVCFPVDDKGRYEVLQVHPKGKFCVTMKEPELKTLLAKRALDLGVKAINRTMAVKLLKNGERLAGAIGMNVRTGENILCRAKSVILSAGGTARFGLPNNGNLYGVYDFPGNTGDGYCLAYDAGAELSGFEYTLIYYIVKDINAPLLYITLTRGADLLTAYDEHREKDHPSIKSMLLDQGCQFLAESLHPPEGPVEFVFIFGRSDIVIYYSSHLVFKFFYWNQISALVQPRIFGRHELINLISIKFHLPCLCRVFTGIFGRNFSKNKGAR